MSGDCKGKLTSLDETVTHQTGVPPISNYCARNDQSEKNRKIMDERLELEFKYRIQIFLD
jgi:hypothetical protein